MAAFQRGHHVSEFLVAEVQDQLAITDPVPRKVKIGPLEVLVELGDEAGRESCEVPQLIIA
jgi:hypothetical protein